MRQYIVCGTAVILCLAMGCADPLTSTNTAVLKSDDVRTGTRYSLPLRMLQIQIWEWTPKASAGKEKKKKGQKYAILAGAPYVPDPRAQYVLTHNASSLSHEKISWTVEDGFLKEVRSTLKDESLGAVAGVVSLLVEVAKASAGVGGGMGTPKARLAADSREFIAQYVVDPLSPWGVKQLKRIKDEHEVDISVTEVNHCAVRPTQATCGPLDPQCFNGVAYRVEYPYVLTMSPMAVPVPQKAPKEPLHELVQHAEQVVLMPNRSPVTLMPITREAFVEKRMDLDFTNGVLTKVDVEKPSALKGFLDGLLEPVRAIVSIPGELLQLRITQTTRQKNLVQSETELLKQMQEYLKVLEEQRALRQGQGSGRRGPGLGGEG